MTSPRKMPWLGLIAIALTLSSSAQAQRGATEMPGAADHPLLSRYAGSVLHAVSQPVFQQLLVPAGPPQSTRDGFVFKPALQVEGDLSGRFYVAPKERSAQEVFRNYEQALGAAGFKVLYRCEMKACDGAVRDMLTRQQMELPRWPKERFGNPRSPFERDIRFLSAQFQQGGRQAFVQLYVAEPDSIWQAPAVMQLVLEPKAMDDGQVLVNASKLRQGLGAEGRIALYGLSFDTGKAVIKPESRAQLVEMAAVLAADPSMRVAIVGHTDTEGTVEANLKLSQARAEAVVQALVRDHGVSAARLDAKGVAAYAPVASNASPEGRAKNRRVEMVQR